jgi:hypothetical protein
VNVQLLEDHGRSSYLLMDRRLGSNRRGAQT